MTDDRLTEKVWDPEADAFVDPAQVGRPHLVPEHPGDRGFKWMPALPSAYNGDTGTVRLVESSLAEGPHVAVYLQRDAESWAGLAAVDELIPLDAENAWRLKEQIEWLLGHHYQGDARPPSETLRPSPDSSDADLIVALSAEVTRLTLAVDRHREVDRAAKRLLDNATPSVSALELDGPGIDGRELYADLADALGLGEDYRPEGA
jgi:hypothetical protein